MSTTNIHEITPATQYLQSGRRAYREVRSHLMGLATDANRFSYALHFESLDKIIEGHVHQGCSHHKESCRREVDQLFELAILMKAIQSSTSNNSIPVNILLSSD